MPENEADPPIGDPCHSNRMNNSPAKPRTRVIAKEIYMAFAAGLFVGLIVWLQSQSRPGSTNSMVMSIVFVAAASAAVVCCIFAVPGRPSPKVRVHEVPAWLCAIGCGILLSMHGLNFLPLAS